MSATVSNTLIDAAGNPIQGADVTITLLGLGQNIIAFDKITSNEIFSPVILATNNQGTWSCTLQQNSNITPGGTYWGIDENSNNVGGFPTRQYFISVPGAGPYTVNNILTAPSTVITTYSNLVGLLNSAQTWTQQNNFASPVGLGAGVTLLTGVNYNPNGVLVGVAGEFAFRSDTPTVANQRLYVCTGSTAWTGII